MFPDSEIDLNGPSSASTNPLSVSQHVPQANTNARRDPQLSAIPTDKEQSYGNSNNVDNPNVPSASQITNGAPPTPATDAKQTHPASGYTWTRDEDAPSYGWRNKKAMEDYHRAVDLVVDKDRMIGRESHFEASQPSILLTTSRQIWRHWR